MNAFEMYNYRKVVCVANYIEAIKNENRPEITKGVNKYQN
jgi:hypothetical protein